MRYDQTLERFKSAPIQLIPITSLQTSKALQPREPRLVPFRDKGRSEDNSEQHIATLRLLLDGSQEIQLDPILVADITEHPPATVSGLHLVDGHHRLRAYSQAGRQLIPAHVLATDYRTAVLVSKLANCTGRSLAMHREQCRDAAWQYLADVTQQGATGLPDGDSLRLVGARFGISKNTVDSMLKHLPKIERKDFHSMALDPGTGWPRWRHVREVKQGWRLSLPSSPEEQFDRDAENVARQIIKIVDASSPATRARALQMLANDEVLASDQIGSVDFLSHFSPSPNEVLPRSLPSQLGHSMSRSD